MKITDYNLNLHSNSTATELKQSASKTEPSTSETSLQGHFASEQGAVFSASATAQSELKFSSDQDIFKNIIKFADEAIKSLKNLRDSLGLGGGENDSIFAGLRVWLNDREGSRLIALGETGVGAIFLGYTQSGFELKNSDDKTLGVLQKSGVFLFKNGEAGVISHIDIAKQTPVYA